MTFATLRNWDSRRSLALISALAVLMSLMIIYAAPAQAHHPTTTASQICVDGEVYISFTSTSWQIGEPGHPDVRVQVSVNGGTWTEVGSGAYSSGNGYSFSGTFAAQAYWGESIQVRSQVVGNWPNGAATGNGNPEATTGTFTVDQDCQVDEPVEVTVTGGECIVGEQDQPVGSAEITIDPNSGATVTIYSDAGMTNEVAELTSSDTITGLAPGTYYWVAQAADGFELTGESQGDFTIDPCDVTVSASGSCEVVDNVGVGTIEITVSVPGSVSLEIPGVGTFDESDTATVATDATYSWSATPNAGFAISGDSSGEIVIDDCTPPPPPPEVGASILVTVDSTCDVVDGQGQGVIDVVVSVDDGATVVIRDSAGEVVETLTSDGSVTVTAGSTYTWEASPNTGFEFPPGFVASGSIDIEDCTPTPPPPPPTPDEVLASILVTVDGLCEDGDGFVDINLSVAGGATVVVSDSDGDVMGTLTADGTVAVPDGATYNWVATPSEGFEFPPGFVASGTITIESCSNPETLPFTGMDLDVAAAFAAAFLGAGITVLASQWRREEQ